MKTVIVTFSVLLLLLVFPIQNLRDAEINNKLDAFDEAFNNFIEKARMDGYFKQDNIDSMKNSILALFPELSAGDISMTLTMTPKYRQNFDDDREHITYLVQFPVKDVILLGGVLGIRSSDNVITIKKQGYVLSEVLMP